MNKKYKLKKDWIYAKAGDVIEQMGVGDGYRVGKFYLGQREIDENPEWFEEIKPREWEVTAFRFTKNSAYNNSINRLQPNGKFEGGYSFESMWDNGRMGYNREIYSVKKINDGEELTIGDQIEWDQSKTTITGFEISPRNGNMLVKYNCGGVGIKKIKKVKVPTDWDYDWSPSQIMPDSLFLNGVKYISTAEIERIKREAFNAARDQKIGQIENGRMSMILAYSTFEDYKKQNHD